MYDPARDSWDERRDDASRKSPEGRFSRLVCSNFLFNWYPFRSWSSSIIEYYEFHWITLVVDVQRVDPMCMYQFLLLLLLLFFFFFFFLS